MHGPARTLELVIGEVNVVCPRIGACHRALQHGPLFYLARAQSVRDGAPHTQTCCARASSIGIRRDAMLAKSAALVVVFAFNVYDSSPSRSVLQSPARGTFEWLFESGMQIYVDWRVS